MFEFSKKMPMLDQLISGLQSFGVLECIRNNRKELETVFVQSTVFTPTADVLLQSIETEFSETGSNKKEEEINIFKYFSDFVEDSEGSG